MAYNQYDLANTSLVKTGSLTEMYIPLWVYSGGSAAIINSTYAYLIKGGTGSTGGIASSNKFHTLSTNWLTSQSFSFEASIYSSTATPASATIWDMTSNIQVSNSTISTSSTTATLIRSGQFTLIPGHAYGIALKSDGTATAHLTKASLIAFLS